MSVRPDIPDIPPLGGCRMPAASPAMSGRGAGDGDLYAQNQAPQRLAAARAGFRTEADLAVSLEMFTCERLTMRLSRPACAKL